MMNTSQKEPSENVGPSIASPNIVDFILAKMEARGMSRRALAEAAGVHRSRVQRVLHPNVMKRTPIRLSETVELLGALGVGHYEVALANELLSEPSAPAPDSLAKVIALVSVIFDGLPSEIISMVGLIDGLEYDDIREIHGKRIQAAMIEMMRDLYTEMVDRRYRRIDHTAYRG